jgi:hypothetical protein
MSEENRVSIPLRAEKVADQLFSKDQRGCRRRRNLESSSPALHGDGLLADVSHRENIDDAADILQGCQLNSRQLTPKRFLEKARLHIALLKVGAGAKAYDGDSGCISLGHGLP